MKDLIAQLFGTSDVFQLLQMERTPLILKCIAYIRDELNPFSIVELHHRLQYEIRCMYSTCAADKVALNMSDARNLSHMTSYISDDQPYICKFEYGQNNYPPDDNEQAIPSLEFENAEPEATEEQSCREHTNEIDDESAVENGVPSRQSERCRQKRTIQKKTTHRPRASRFNQSGTCTTTDSKSTPATAPLAAGSMIVYGVDIIAKRMGLDYRPRLLLENAKADPDNLSSAMMGTTARWLDGPDRNITTMNKAVLSGMKANSANAHTKLCTNATGEVSGLSWLQVDKASGDELVNNELANALQHKTRFTRNEWNAFGVRKLSSNSYIVSGDSYFRPQAKEDLLDLQRVSSKGSGFRELIS